MKKRRKIYVNHNQTIILIVAAFLMIFCALPILVSGQPGLPAEPEQMPIDGGLSILAAIGGGYAVKKLRDNRKQ